MKYINLMRVNKKSKQIIIWFIFTCIIRQLYYSTGLIVINLDKIKATKIVDKTNITTKIQNVSSENTSVKAGI